MCPNPQRIKEFHLSISYNRMLAKFSAKGQIVNVFGLAGHMTPVASTGLCCVAQSRQRVTRK